MREARERSTYERYATNNKVDNDEKIAQQIQRRLWIEEERARRSAEEADERLAQKLAQKDRARQQRKRLEKEKQQVERLSAQIGADYRIDTPSISSNSPPWNDPIPSPPTYHRILTEDEQELDLSEFCMPPPPGLTPEELKYFLEEQDAEIARLLQQQELKRNKNPVKEKLAVIEAQDYELARMLQKMEKDRVRRIKDKLRAKQTNNNRTDDANSSNLDLVSGQFDSGSYFQRTSTPISPQNSLDGDRTENAIDENEYDIPENHLNEDADGDSITYEEPYQVLSQAHIDQHPLRHSFHNIAIDLDPTYQRRLQSNTPQSTTSRNSNNLVESSVDEDELPNGPRCAHDSLEKLYQRSNSRPDIVTPSAITSTTSSRSSRSSSSSGRSGENRNQRSSSRLPSVVDVVQDDYAPPLPPRDVSLLNRNRMESNDEVIPSATLATSNQSYLPPHHPQHPNRLVTLEPLFSNYSTSSIPLSHYMTANSQLPVQGQRRGFSIEKPSKKVKHKSQDGCRTQ